MTLFLSEVKSLGVGYRFSQQLELSLDQSREWGRWDSPSSPCRTLQAWPLSALCSSARVCLSQGSLQSPARGWGRGGARRVWLGLELKSRGPRARSSCTQRWSGRLERCFGNLEKCRDTSVLPLNEKSLPNFLHTLDPATAGGCPEERANEPNNLCVQQLGTDIV